MEKPEVSPKLQRVTIAATQLAGAEIALAPSQEHYLRRVLRLPAGSHFIATTGSGRAWLARMAETGMAQILAEVEQQGRELPVPVTAIVALPKGSGFEAIVRAGTELGANAFVPVLTARTLLKPAASKLGRWQRIATEAAEQSEREYVPAIAAPTPFATAIAAPELQAPKGQRYLCVARQDVPHLGRLVRADGPIVIATGCEGGWTEAEIAAAMAAGFTPATLGKRVLRAVTAPLAALAAISVVLEG